MWLWEEVMVKAFINSTILTEPGSMGQLDLNDFVHILPKSKATEKISKNK